MIIDETFKFDRPLTPEQREHLQQWFAGLIKTLKVEHQRNIERKRKLKKETKQVRKKRNAIQKAK
jgi:hypothetical protein